MKRFVGFLSLLVLLLNSVLMPLTYAQEYQDEILDTQVNNTIEDSSNVENVSETDDEQNEEAEDASEFPVIEENPQEPEITPVDETQDEDQDLPSESTGSGGLEGFENVNQEGVNGLGSGNDLDEILLPGAEENLNVQSGAGQIDDVLSGVQVPDYLNSSGNNVDDVSEDTGFFSSIANSLDEFLGFSNLISNDSNESDIKLFSEETFTVTFDANRGTFVNLPSTQTVTSGSLITNLPSADPELPGYDFDGWFTAVTGGRQWNLDNDVVTGDLTLYAHWTYNLTYGDLDIYVIDNNKQLVKYVMMDRNLGATSVYDKNFDSPNFSSFGFAYQWGNNYGFPRVDGNNNTYSRSDTRSTQVPYSDWQNQVPSKYTSSTWVGNSSGKPNPWHQNNTTDIKNSSKNLWGGVDGTYESMQGPCPDGYHLPDKNDISNTDGLLRVWANVYDKTIGSVDNTTQVGFPFDSADEKIFTEQFLLPIAGAHKKGNFTEQEQGKCANYSSAVTTTDERALSIWFCTDDSGNTYYKKAIKLENGGERNNGISVRCFKNSKDSANIEIHPDKGTKGVVSIHKLGNITTINEIKDPVRIQEGLGNLIFDGWYTDPNFAEESYVTGGSILSAQDAALYAKWSCPDDYEYDGEICIVPFDIKFDASGGSFDIGGESQTTIIKPLIYGTVYNYSDLPTPTRPGYIFKGWYAEFDGVDDYVDYGADLRFNDKISIHLSAYMDDWSEFDTDDQRGDRIISCTKGDNGGWAIKTKSSKMQFGCMDDVTGTSWKSANSNMLWSSLQKGWHDFDAVFDGQNAYLYVDGSKLATSSKYSSGKLKYDSNTSISIGGQPDYERTYFKGKIKDVIIQHSDQRITLTGVLLVPNQNVTYYALWEERTGNYDVEVTITPSTGGNVTGTGVYDEGSEITLTATPNIGYQFSGWYDESDNLVSNVNPYIFTADASAGTGLKAVFELKQYTVSVESNDEDKGTISYPTGPYTHGMSIQFSPVVSNPLLYKFLKWNLNGGDVLTLNDEYLTGNLVIEELTGNVNVIGFFTGYNSCSFNNQTIKHGETVTGYQSATVSYDESCVSEIRTCNDGTLDGSYQFASCSRQAPASCLLPWGGELPHGESVTGYKTSSVTCPNSCESQQATCNNGNWNVENFATNYTSSTCTLNEYSCGEGFTLDVCPDHGTCSEPCTPYAVSEYACVPGIQKYKLISCEEGYHVDNDKCVANEYNVIFDANGGNGIMTQDTATYGLNYTIKNSNFTKDGFTFTGWNTKVDKSGIRYYSGQTVLWSFTGDLRLYAQWKVNTYIVTYDATSHSGTINNQPTSGEAVSYNTTIILPSSGIESQNGYIFQGWTTTLGGTEPISNTQTITSDVTFYPIFKKDGEQKDIRFYVNNNSGYIYDNVSYTEDRLFSGCSIPTLYNTDPYTGSCSVHITLPEIIAHENTPMVLGWSTGTEERTISYATGVGVTITIPRGKEVELYAQTKSEEKEYTAIYETDSRVEEVTETSNTCIVPVTYNGNSQQITCTEAITLPNITAKNGYNTPVWKLGKTEYAGGASLYLSGNVILTGTATPDTQTPYIVKHYYQTIANTNVYQLSGVDNLSGATENILTLSELQENVLENTGFIYYQARVNDENVESINITSIDDFVEEAEIQPGLVIQLFYTRKVNSVTLNTIEHATVEKSPAEDSYYYGETIIFNGYTEEGYTFSGWTIKEGDNESQTVLGTPINYTMPSTGVVVTPVIKEHTYTIHFDSNGAVGNIADQSALYSESVVLPTLGDVEDKLINTGHHFVGWTTGATETTVLTELSKATAVDNGEVTLYAKWDVNDGTQYLVKYYLEPVEEGKDQSEYILQDVFTGAAPTNSVVTGVLKNYDGFTTPLELTGIVAANGSLVIKYYYTRNTYTYTFNAGEGANFEDGETSTDISFRYEQTVVEPELSVVKTGFTKTGWTPVLPTTMPHENKTSTAVWSENHYAIEYDANGGVGETPTQSNIGYTEHIFLTGNQFSKEGYSFVGWSITRDGDIDYLDKIEVNGLTGEDNAVIVLYAQWEANFYTVSFNANSGDVVQTGKTVIYDGTYGYLPEANRVGYTFKGWYTDKISGEEVTSDTKVTRTENHTLYAHWIADTYTVTFNANGGVVSQTDKTVTYDESYGVMPTPTRVGYSFAGWYTEQIGGEKITADTKVTIAISHTLYAQWIANKYIVTFNANGGVVSQSTGEVTYNQPYGVLPIPIREGYAFSGWYTHAEGGEYITGTITVTRTGDHTLYAQWKANTYIVIFDANSGDVTETDRQLTFDEEYGELPVATRTGYTFSGWYTQVEGGEYVTGTTTVTTASNHTLYAHWTENHYTVAFDANGGEGTMVPMEDILYTENRTLSENTFTRDGYQFNGWSITVDGGVKYEDKTEVSRLTGENNAIVMLYAVWQKGAYNISYELNGGALTGGKINPVGYDVDTDTFTLNNPEREGYDFLGWSGTDLTELTKTVTIAKGSIGNRSYEANWKATEYTIIYNLSGGVLPAGKLNPDMYTIESGNFTFINPEREGYDFLGWSGTDLTELTKTVIISQGSTGNRVYEANWKIKTYTITWMNSTGSLLEKDENVEYGSMPSYDGEEPISGGNVQYTYSFSGWNPQTGMVVKDQVYTAVYNSIVNQYAVTFVDEDGTILKVSTNYDYNTPASGIEKPSDPTKSADAQYTYAFAGWNPEVHDVTGAQVYTATYNSTVNSYTIIWNDWDGTELERDVDVVYGASPLYNGSTPTSGATAQYTYTFNGWLPGVHSVTGPEVYTATYKNTLRSYPITFYDEDGITVVKSSTMYPYGTQSTIYKPVTNPTKVGYSFDKWIPELEAVVGTADYKASYKINSYKVTPVKGVGVADVVGGGTFEYNTVITLTGYAKAGYHFEGGETVKTFNVTVPSNSISVTITAYPNTYYVHYDPNGGTGVMLDQLFVYDQEQELSANTYTNEGLYFKEWTDLAGHQYKNKSKVKNLATTGVIDLLAVWTDTPEPTPPAPTPTPTPGESVAGGGRIIAPTENEHESADFQTGAIVHTGDDILGPDEQSVIGDDSYDVTGTTTRTEEEMDAYKYAYKYHITTLAPREAAMPDAYVQRGHMAKMIVNYSINVLHKKLPEKLPEHCKWKDTADSWESQEIKDYAEKACALGLMGIDMNYFQPNKYVTRAQFGTIFGRLLRGKLPSTPYYAAHLAGLKERGIMTQIDHPEDRVEIRKWAWLMFMRSEKYFKI